MTSESNLDQSCDNMAPYQDTYMLFFPSNTDAKTESLLIAEAKQYGFELIFTFEPLVSLLNIKQMLDASIKYWRFFKKGKNNQSLKCVLLLDLNRMPLTLTQSRLYPKVDNARVLHLAAAISRKIMGPDKQSKAPIFSTLSSNDTAQVMKLTQLNQFQLEIEALLKSRWAEFQTPYKPMCSIYQYSFSAKIEVVYHQEMFCVLKTFRPSCKEHLQNELIAYQELSKAIPEIPPLLSYGTNYLLIPYYPGQKKFDFSGVGLLSVATAKSMLQVLKAIYENGYSLIDSHPKNFLYDVNGDMKIIDFEYLFKYSQKPKSYDESLDLQGYTPNFSGLTPADQAHYKTRWLPYLGLTYTSLMSDSMAVKKIKRAVFWLIYRLPIYVLRRSYALYRFLLGIISNFLRKLHIEMYPPKMKP